VPTYFIENEAYFNREEFYGLGDEDYPDNLERFVFFCKAALECCKATEFAPDVIHCNDWQTAVLPAMLKATYAAYHKDPFFNPIPKLVYSIHNISYQGRFPEDQWPILSLPRSYYTYDFEFYGQINLTKSAIHLADAITTVSETYAREIQTTDFGFGLQDDLQARKEDLYGILNGADYQQWSPDADPYTYGIHYSADDLSGKRRIKSKLRADYQLPDSADLPIIGMTTRFVEQKGIDLITECAEKILQLDTQMIVLGSGEPRYHDFFEWLRRSYPDRVGIYIGFNNELAHKIEAGADIFLMPSLFEPCGLNQIYSLKYGTLPIVRLTGGLADTIQDDVNGFTFFDFNADAFLNTVNRAIDVYRNHPDVWEKMMITGMGQDFSWQTSAEKYLAVYSKLLSINARI
jgi:starch synthase